MCLIHHKWIESPRSSCCDSTSRGRLEGSTGQERVSYSLLKALPLCKIEQGTAVTTVGRITFELSGLSIMRVIMPLASR
jgi:hypothetical protein